jgi:hypothetical protein
MAYWQLRLHRGVELFVAAFRQENWIAVPVCAHCRRRRRLATFLAFASVLMPFLLLFFLDEGLGWIETDLTDVAIAFAAMVLMVGLWRSWGFAQLDRVFLGVAGVRLEKGGRSGYVWFRDRRLAEEVVALTREVVESEAGKPRMPRLPTYAGTT